ncbi:hypothetical protein CEXT_147561 [Caerostris extrusa]|uniref:Uncharacterized protein n=1 Tax=Caerostris extrusa TaxID=172846 RepID=A0AAV4PDA0_CAEEX|nr:hypothetical protein CEXT_147561 [Caerostris extrusa]
MMEFEVIRESAKIWEVRRVGCPKSTCSPRELGGVLQIHLDILGQIFVLGKVTHFDDDDAVHVVLEFLCEYNFRWHFVWQHCSAQKDSSVDLLWIGFQTQRVKEGAFEGVLELEGFLYKIAQ